MKGKLRKYALNIAIGALLVAVGAWAAQLVNVVSTGTLQSQGGITVVLNTASAVSSGGDMGCVAAKTGDTTFSLAITDAAEDGYCDVTLNATNSGSAVANATLPSVSGAGAPYVAIGSWDMLIPSGGTTSDVFRVTIGAVPDDANLAFQMTLPLAAE